MLLKLPAEVAHSVAMTGLAQFSGIVPKVRLGSLRGLEAEHMGLKFNHPVCLAAGLDKNAIAIRGLEKFGFAGMEVGSITCEPQSGNPSPRLFRLPETAGLINRMGFNSEGLEAASSRLAHRRGSMIVGVNMGLNKGFEDYETQFRTLTRHLAPQADYVTINLSSPNTPGLRSLLETKHVKSVLNAVHQGLGDAEIHRPVVLKLSPDMEPLQEAELLAFLSEVKINGVIAGNTTVDRSMLPVDLEHRDEIGGLSGIPLADRARSLLSRVVAAMPPDVTIIASGGIFTGEDLFSRLAAGAHLVQIYTSFIYGGRMTVPSLLNGLKYTMDKNKISHLSELWDGS